MLFQFDGADVELKSCQSAVKSNIE